MATPTTPKTGKPVLNVVRSITFGDVIEAGYDDFPVLGRTPMIPCFVECGDHPSGELRTLRLALTVDQARQLVDQVSELLRGYAPREEGAGEVH